MPTKHATAVWEGGLKTGKGSYTADSGSFKGSFAFPNRFEEAGGTSPEELLAAAHAACLSMALSAGLEGAGTVATRIEVRAACTIDGPKVSRMVLTVRGRVPGIDQGKFAEAAEAAKNGCPISGALKGNVEFVLDAKLE
jgi:osmotically inducible protein OsmC